MSLRDLVKQWAEAEPERCVGVFEGGVGYMAGRWMTVVRLGGGLRSLFSELDGEQKADNEAAVLAAVIEAIEARAGDWSLAGGKGRPNSAIVTHVTRVDGTLRVGSVIGPDRRTPAEALLAAYLKAVQHHQAGE